MNLLTVDVLLALALVAFLVAAWLLTLVGLPGNWLMVGGTGLYILLVGAESRTAISWSVLLVLIALAILAEVGEAAAGSVWTARVGGSRQAIWLSLVGSMIGAVLGAVVGLPIPLVGWLLGAIFFAGCGAMIGAILGEQSQGRSLEQSLEVGRAAFWGRLWGSLTKIALGAVMLLVATTSLIV